MSLMPRPPAAMPLAELLGGPLRDRFGRVKRKLRVSLTDRCNFRCPYCMPDQPEFSQREDRLDRKALRRLLRIFVTGMGVTHLRLTGGEPLLRRDLEAVIEECGALRPLGLERISLTSNAALLVHRAAGLKAVGLDDLNISLDALTPQTFARLSGGRPVQPVLEGIAAARAAGLPLKLNAVIMRGVNEDEILPLTRWAMAQQLPLRFIEFMPLDGRHEWSQQSVVTQAEILAQLRGEYGVQALPRGSDPAAYFELSGGGRVGVIATVSNPFCASCDRLRLTADGKLYTCLFSARGTALPATASDAELGALIRDAVWHKDAGYAAQPGYAQRPIAMNALGG